MNEVKEAVNLRKNPIKPLNRFSRIRRTEAKQIDRNCRNCKFLGATEDYIHFMCTQESIILDEDQLMNSDCKTWRPITEPFDCRSCKNNNLGTCTKDGESAEKHVKWLKANEIRRCKDWENSKETECCWNCNHRHVVKGDSVCKLHNMSIRNWVEKQCDNWEKYKVFG